MNVPNDLPVSPDGVTALTFPQSQHDFRAAVDFRSKRWSARIIYAVFAVLATYATVVLVWYFVVGPIQSLVPVVVTSVVLCIAFYFGIRRLNVWSATRQFLRSKQGGKIDGSTCTLTVQDGMLTSSREALGASLTMPVSNLERIEKTKSHVFVWTTKVNVCPIPRQSVPKGDLDAFLRALSNP